MKKTLLALFLATTTSSHAATIIINPPTVFPGWSHEECPTAFASRAKGVQGIEPYVNSSFCGDPVPIGPGFPPINWTMPGDRTSFGYVGDGLYDIHESNVFQITDLFIRDESVHLLLIPFIITDLSNPSQSQIWDTIAAVTITTGGKMVVTGAAITAALGTYGLFRPSPLINTGTTAAAIVTAIGAYIELLRKSPPDPLFSFYTPGYDFNGTFNATPEGSALTAIQNINFCQYASGCAPNSFSNKLTIPELSIWYMIMLGFFSIGIFYKCERIG